MKLTKAQRTLLQYMADGWTVQARCSEWTHLWRYERIGPHGTDCRAIPVSQRVLQQLEDRRLVHVPKQVTGLLVYALTKSGEQVINSAKED